MTMKNKDKVLKRITEIVNQYPGVVGMAMYQQATIIARESLKQCPVDFGRLRASFYLAPPENNSFPVVKLGYGTKYAIYVHEMVGNKHPVGKAKFLEDPVNEAKSSWLNKVAARASSLIKSGVTSPTYSSVYPTTPGEVTEKAVKKARNQAMRERAHRKGGHGK